MTPLHFLCPISSPSINTQLFLQNVSSILWQFLIITLINQYHVWPKYCNTRLTSVLASIPPYSQPILISESRVIVLHHVRTCPSSTQNCSMVLILLRMKDKVLKIACKILQSILSPILVFFWSHFFFLSLCSTPKWPFCSSNASQNFLRFLHCCSLSLKHSSQNTTRLIPSYPFCLSNVNFLLKPLITTLLKIKYLHFCMTCSTFLLYFLS